MFFNKRGLTVGDLTILVILILFSFFIINKVRETKSEKQITNVYQLEKLKYFS